LQRRLSKMGIPVRLNELMTSAYAASRHLLAMRPLPRSVYVLGERGLRNELLAAGFCIMPTRLSGEHSSTTTF